VLLLAVAGIGCVIVAQITLSYLDPADDNSDEVVSEEQVGDRLSSIFDEVEERTTQGGSSCTPISIDGPHDWPLAAFRTLTRPLLYEARGLIGGIAAVAVARTGALEPTIGPALITVAIALPTSLAAALLVDSISRRNDRRR
jgi:hypothetical protein